MTSDNYNEIKDAMVFPFFDTHAFIMHHYAISIVVLYIYIVKY